MPPKRTLSDVLSSEYDSSDSSGSYVISEEDNDHPGKVKCTHCRQWVAPFTERSHRKFAPIHDEYTSSSDSDSAPSSEDGPLILAVPRMSIYLLVIFPLEYNLQVLVGHQIELLLCQMRRMVHRRWWLMPIWTLMSLVCYTNDCWLLQHKFIP